MRSCILAACYIVLVGGTGSTLSATQVRRCVIHEQKAAGRHQHQYEVIVGLRPPSCRERMWLVMRLVEMMWGFIVDATHQIPRWQSTVSRAPREGER